MSAFYLPARCPERLPLTAASGAAAAGRALCIRLWRTDEGERPTSAPFCANSHRELGDRQVELVGLGPRTNFKQRRWQHRVSEFGDPQPREIPLTPVQAFASWRVMRSSFAIWAKRGAIGERSIAAPTPAGSRDPRLRLLARRSRRADGSRTAVLWSRGRWTRPARRWTAPAAVAVNLRRGWRLGPARWSSRRGVAACECGTAARLHLPPLPELLSRTGRDGASPDNKRTTVSLAGRHGALHRFAARHLEQRVQLPAFLSGGRWQSSARRVRRDRPRAERR